MDGGLLSLTLRWDTFSETYFFDRRFDTELFLCQEGHSPLADVYSRVASLQMTSNLRITNRVTPLSLYNILNAHIFPFRFSIHVIYFRWPLCTIRHRCNILCTKSRITGSQRLTCNTYQFIYFVFDGITTFLCFLMAKPVVVLFDP